MKKIVSVLVAFVVFLSLAVPAQAAEGAITNDEQRILTALDHGVTVGGKTFNITATDRTQAENYLKQKELTTAEVDAVVSNIDAARALAAAQNVDVTNINSLRELLLAFPTDVVAQLKDYVLAAADVLGLKVTFGPGSVSIVDTTGSDSVTSGGSNPVYTTGSAVKQTGVSYVASIATVGALLVIAAGAFVVGKKSKLA